MGGDREIHTRFAIVELSKNRKKVTNVARKSAITNMK
jgi:hypothetical protein